MEQQLELSPAVPAEGDEMAQITTTIASNSNSVIGDEIKHLNNKLAELNLHVVDVSRDGNCLFHVMLRMLQSKKVQNVSDDVQVLRLYVVDILRRNWRQYWHCVLHFCRQFQLQYLCKMEQSGTYADYLIIYTFCYIYGVTITVHYKNGSSVIHTDGIMGGIPSANIECMIGSVLNTHFVCVKPIVYPIMFGQITDVVEV